MEEVFLQKKYTMEEASSTLFFKWRKYCLKIDEDSSCKEEKVEDFILKPEKLMETKKLRAASPLSLSIFWAKKNNSPWVWGRRINFFCPKGLSGLEARNFFVSISFSDFKIKSSTFSSWLIQKKT